MKFEIKNFEFKSGEIQNFIGNVISNWKLKISIWNKIFEISLKIMNKFKIALKNRSSHKKFGYSFLNIGT
jgi:hypothetical protein